MCLRHMVCISTSDKLNQFTEIKKTSLETWEPSKISKNNLLRIPKSSGIDRKCGHRWLTQSTVCTIYRRCLFRDLSFQTVDDKISFSEWYMLIRWGRVACKQDPEYQCDYWWSSCESKPVKMSHSDIISTALTTS